MKTKKIIMLIATISILFFHYEKINAIETISNDNYTVQEDYKENTGVLKGLNITINEDFINDDNTLKSPIILNYKIKTLLHPDYKVNGIIYPNDREGKQALLYHRLIGRESGNLEIKPSSKTSVNGEEFSSSEFDCSFTLEKINQNTSNQTQEMMYYVEPMIWYEHTNDYSPIPSAQIKPIPIYINYTIKKATIKMGNVQVDLKDKMNDILLKDGKFKLLDSDNNEVLYDAKNNPYKPFKTTNGNEYSSINIQDLKIGKYTLKQTVVPTNYRILKEYENGVEFNIEDGKTTNLVIENEKIDIPKTNPTIIDDNSNNKTSNKNNIVDNEILKNDNSKTKNAFVTSKNKNNKVVHYSSNKTLPQTGRNDLFNILLLLTLGTIISITKYIFKLKP